MHESSAHHRARVLLSVLLWQRLVVVPLAPLDEVGARLGAELEARVGRPASAWVERRAQRLHEAASGRPEERRQGGGMACGQCVLSYTTKKCSDQRFRLPEASRGAVLRRPRHPSSTTGCRTVLRHDACKRQVLHAHPWSMCLSAPCQRWRPRPPQRLERRNRGAFDSHAVDDGSAGRLKGGAAALLARGRKGMGKAESSRPFELGG
eukprot:43835-Chlamydomonas_euryale.AAC.6